ncbi:saccharopine dehydrogenase [Nocardia sp. NBC_01329]|uniref:saccharopine dehydrogenase n=1 Tax=Nocardia sp. NBC_01329 TaxID=2903594 RepID=UPI002E0EF244|nr:saccharopine dehydrogenase [Nocardia sp. NBC_01329]
MSEKQLPVLIVGGSGVVGAKTAGLLRALHPELPITIGGRDREKARAVAARIGGAETATIDLDRPDLGLPADHHFGAIAVLLRDRTLNTLRYATAERIPYLSVSTGVFEIGPEVAMSSRHRDRAPVLLASHWLAGAAVFPTLHLTAGYRRLDTIRIGAVLEAADMGGPAAAEDYDRLTTAAPATLVFRNGRAEWITGEDADATVRRADGTVVRAQAYAPFDMISLAAATEARDIRFDLAYDPTAEHPDRPLSTEILIEVSGEKNGTRTTSRYEIVQPGGQAALTALGVALAVERLAGLDGRPAAAPGLYLPETLLDPAYVVGRMQEFGAEIRTRETQEVNA